MPELLTADVETDEKATVEVSATAAGTIEEDALVEDDLLVEDVSIDGMCGVY